MGPDDLADMISASGDPIDLAPAYDPDVRFVQHPSHTTDGGVCTRCSMRIYWPGIREDCQGVSSGIGGVSLAAATHELMERISAFGRWWSRRGHPSVLPTTDEWIAELIEWQRRRRKRSRR